MAAKKLRTWKAWAVLFPGKDKFFPTAGMTYQRDDGLAVYPTKRGAIARAIGDQRVFRVEIREVVKPKRQPGAPK